MDPITRPQRCSTLAESVLASRALSLAHRILAGAGRASMLAYRSDPAIELEAIAHTLTPAGDLMVACFAPPESAVWTMPDLEQADVRLDIVKEAPDFSVRISAAAVHLLGTVTWLPPEVAHALANRSMLPAGVAELATGPRGRLGVVHTERVLLHDSSGVTPIGFTHIAVRHTGDETGMAPTAPFPSAGDELDISSLLAGHPAAALDHLFDEVLAGRTDGAVLSHREREASCHHVRQRVFCVDVDQTGMTLMHVGLTHTSIVVATFDDQATTLSALDRQIRDLVTQNT